MEKSWLTILITIFLYCCLYINPSATDDDFSRALPFCRSTSTSAKIKGANRALIIVSTLDGHISALDAKTGEVSWTFVTEPGVMLSSSLSNLEMTSKGKWFRLIPSLDGGLYRFDGMSIEALPFTAETLLSSSLKLGDDVIISGCNENRVYGIDYASGKLRYECSSDGCKNNENVSSEDVIVVRRRTHVIRAVDPRTGLEKWNYSVGHHEVAFIEGSSFSCSSDKKDDTDVLIGTDNEADSENQQFFSNLNIKFLTPSGQVIGILQDNPAKMIWQYQFKTPVVDAWSLHQNNLEHMDLLSSDHIPSPDNYPLDQSATLYIGMHEKQIYIKQSQSMMNAVSNAAHQNLAYGSYVYPRIQWKPYLVTAVSRTPVITGGNHDDKSVGFQLHLTHGIESTALIVRHDSEYPYDGGFYVFPEETPIDDVVLPQNATDSDENETLQQIVIVSLSYWWKELTALAVLLTIINFLVTRYIMRRWNKTVINTNNNNNSSMSNNNAKAMIALAQIGIGPLMASNVIEPKQPDFGNNDEKNETFISRYLTDFEPIQCLGRGGFGVVFEARNKIDDCHYAIKRICLPNREDAREKVMREVKALAKLDHPGIVRYYNAWLESPPTGWQESLDKQWEAKGMLTPSACLSSEASLEVSASKKMSVVNPLHPFEGGILDNEKELLNSRGDGRKINGDMSGSFSFSRSFIASQDEESGSFSSERKYNKYVPDRSGYRSGLIGGSGELLQLNDEIPFERYNKSNKSVDTSSDSFIVFEDSGCDEKNSNSTADERAFDTISTSRSVTSNGKKSRSNFCDKIDTKVSRPESLNTTDRQGSPYFMHNIPKMYLHIQMQLCKKENLKDWLATHLQRDKLQVLDFFDQIVSAVEYVHDQGLMHRDLKPSNIFFSMDGTIKVGDFGLVATMSEGTDQHTPVGDVPRHHTDQVGTQLYMSPEQTTGQLYSQKVDIFSLGLIFFELIIPFNTQMERLRVMLDLKQHKFPKTFIEEQPDECLFVKEMLSYDAEGRPSAAEIRKHALLQLFQPSPEILRHRRSRNMSRTFSTSSSGSMD